MLAEGDSQSEISKKTRFQKSIVNYWKNKFLIDGNRLPDYEFAYIKFVRSQIKPFKNNPKGFCHYHNGINYDINIEWINEIIQKNNLQIGFNYIKENKQFLEYLTNDFMTDDEYIIPKNTKHYSCSENIKINPSSGYELTEGAVLFQGKNTIAEIDLIMWKDYNQTLPFEEYVKQFYEVVHRGGDAKNGSRKIKLYN